MRPPEATAADGQAAPAHLAPPLPELGDSTQVYQALMTPHGEQSDVPVADFVLTGDEF